MSPNWLLRCSFNRAPCLAGAATSLQGTLLTVDLDPGRTYFSKIVQSLSTELLCSHRVALEGYLIAMGR